MKRIIFLVIGITLSWIASAQTVSFSSSDDYGVQQGGKLITDTHGNIYTFGRFTDTLTIGNNSIISDGYFDMYLAKLSPQLTAQWLIRIGSSQDDGAGDIAFYHDTLFLTGWYSGAFTLGNDTFPFDVNNNQYPAVLITIDTNGNYLDGRSFQTNNSIVGYTTSIEVNDSGIFLGGTMKGEMYFGNNISAQSYMSGTETDLFLARLNLNLDPLWAYCINSVSGPVNASDGLSDLAVDDSGYIYVCGYFGSNPSLNSASLFWGNFVLVSDGGFGFSDFYYGKISPDGVPVWLYDNGGGLPDVVNNICVYDDTTLVIAGRYSDNADIAGIALPPSPNDYSKFIAVLNKNGTAISANRINAGTEFYSLKKGNDNYIYGADITNTSYGLHFFRFDIDSGIVFNDSIAIGNTSYINIDLLPPSQNCSNLVISTSINNLVLYNNDTLINRAGQSYVDLMLLQYFPSGTGLIQPVITAPPLSCNENIGLNATIDPNAGVYHWNVSPQSAGIITGTGNQSVLQPAPGFNGQVYIHCYTTNFCAASSSADSVPVEILSTPYNAVINLVSNSIEGLVQSADSLYWMLNGSGLPQFDNVNTLPCQGAGTYMLIGMNANGCSDTATQFIVCSVSQEELQNKKVNIYPLPADDILYINRKYEGLPELFSATGEKMKIVMDNRKLFTSALPDGIYFLIVTINGERVLQKISIRH